MREILRHFVDTPLQSVPDGAVLLAEGDLTGRVFALAEGELEVLRGETQVAILTEPGSIVGEMSVLLDAPHSATVRALGEAKVHRVNDGAAFFAEHPELGWSLARLLARRLHAGTTYLADLKRQFAGSANHLEMVGEVLESLLHHQESGREPGSDRDPGY
jgi:CRP/FNR family cyclic AMP-dependent transcriptional regulator